MVKGKKISDIILKTNRTTGAYAILFKLNTLKDLMKDKIPLRAPVDLEIGSFIVENKKKSYAFYPPLIKHNNDIVSDRQSVYANKKFFMIKVKQIFIYYNC